MIRPIREHEIPFLSKLASSIVREHYDPILGTEQNDYMLEKFQSEDAIRSQILHGYQYRLVFLEETAVGFMAFYPDQGMMYLSKLYLKKEYRGKHIGRAMVDYLIAESKKQGLSSIFLNVNKHNDKSIAAYEGMGFHRIRSEINAIGHNYYMDDYVYQLDF